MTVTGAAQRQAPAPGLWRNADFLKFWLGESASLLGNQVTVLALPLTAISALGASDQQVGLLRFLQLVPYIGFSLLFGVWVDRVRRRSLMLWSNLVRLLLLATIPLLYWLGALGMAVLLVLACAIGTASVLFDLCWMSYVTTLVSSPEQYVEANAKMGVSTSTADVAGPGIAGVIVGWLGAPVALVSQVGTYLLSLGSLLLIRSREPLPEPPPARRRVLPELREGVRWVFGNRILRWLTLLGFCCNFSMIAVWTLFLLYGTRDLHLPPSTIGTVFATASAGGLLGAVLSRRVIRRFRIGRVYLVSMAALLLGPTVLVLAGGPRPLLLGLFVSSFFITYLGLGVANVVVITLRQTTTPQALMGRMTASFRMVLFGGGALGGLCAGLLSAALGARGALGVVATASALAVVGLLVSPVSRLPAPPPAAQA